MDNGNIARGQEDERLIVNSVVPDGATMGREDYLPDESPVRKGFTALLDMLTPKEKPGFAFPSNPDVDLERSSQALAKAMAEIMREFDREVKPVRVTPSDQLVMLRTQVGITNRELIGRQVDRLRITITNRHASNTVYLSHQLATATTDTGIELKAGESLTLDTRAAICAVASGENTTLDLIMEMDAA